MTTPGPAGMSDDAVQELRIVDGILEDLITREASDEARAQLWPVLYDLAIWRGQLLSEHGRDDPPRTGVAAARLALAALLIAVSCLALAALLR